jgi:hypothetical protein
MLSHSPPEPQASREALMAFKKPVRGFERLSIYLQKACVK